MKVLLHWLQYFQTLNGYGCGDISYFNSYMTADFSMNDLICLTAWYISWVIAKKLVENIQQSLEYKDRMYAVTNIEYTWTTVDAILSTIHNYMKYQVTALPTQSFSCQ